MPQGAAGGGEGSGPTYTSVSTHGLQSLVMERFQFHQWPPQILEMTVIHGKKDGGQKENQTPQ